MTAALLALLLWCLPADDPKPITTGRQEERAGAAHGGCGLPELR